MKFALYMRLTVNHAAFWVGLVMFIFLLSQMPDAYRNADYVHLSIFVISAVAALIGTIFSFILMRVIAIKIGRLD